MPNKIEHAFNIYIAFKPTQAEGCVCTGSANYDPSVAG